MTELGPFTLWELLPLMVVVPALIATVGVWLGHRKLKSLVREGHNDVVVPIYLTTGVIYGILLGFLVITIWTQFTAAENDVSDEAAALTTMYRQTVGIPEPERSAVRIQLRRYTEAVIGPEWKLQQHGGYSPAARNDIEEIYRTLARQPPKVASSPINVEFLHELTVVSSDRSKRKLASEDQLPWVLWFGLILGGVILVAMSCSLYMENTWLHACLSSVLASMIGVLLFITVVLDHPFRGALGIKPHPFEYSLTVYNSVDESH